MVDAVTTTVLVNEAARYVVRLTNLSDGTGESAVLKVNKSDLTDIRGREPRALDVESIKGNVSGMAVTLLWDHATDSTIAVLQGGEVDLDFRKVGGLRDPKLYDSTGDILLTTAGHTANDSYDLTITLRLRPDD